MHMKCQGGQARADPCSSWRSHSRPHKQLTRGRFEPLSLRRWKPPARTISLELIAPHSKNRHSLWRRLSLRRGDQRPSGDHSEPHQPTLAQLCHLIQQGFFEVGRKFNARTSLTMFDETPICVSAVAAKLLSSLLACLPRCRRGILLSAAPVGLQVGHRLP